MGISWVEWNKLEMSVKEGTPGGTTYVVGGRTLCFAILAGTNKAVMALTAQQSKDPETIDGRLVVKLVDDGLLIVDASDSNGDGWWGTRVWAADEKYIGEVGERCSKAAGYGTDHPGTGRCKFHGGAGCLLGAQKQLKHGGDSKYFRNTLKAKIQQYLNDTNLLDLSGELATQRALLDLLLERLETHMLKDPEYAERLMPGLMRSCSEIGRLAERVASIDQKYALTAGHIRYIQAVVVDILMTHIKDPMVQEQAARELAARLGSGDMALSPVLIKGARIVQ